MAPPKSWTGRRRKAFSENCPQFLHTSSFLHPPLILDAHNSAVPPRVPSVAQARAALLRRADKGRFVAVKVRDPLLGRYPLFKGGKDAHNIHHPSPPPLLFLSTAPLLIAPFSPLVSRKWRGCVPYRPAQRVIFDDAPLFLVGGTADL